MKSLLHITLIILIWNNFSYGQTELIEYITKIESSHFTDTVYLKEDGIDITGFFIEDEVVKAKLVYPMANKERVVYYKEHNSLFHNVCAVQEFKAKNGKKTFQVTSWNNEIQKSGLGKNIKPEKILEECDFTTELGFKRVDDRAQKYSFLGRLVETVPLPAGCGTFAWATAFKFELVESDFQTEDEHVLIIIKCPRVRGEEFYEAEGLYKGIISTNSGVTFSWSIQNQYSNENLPVFWAKSINKI